jgi:hypothetical protein
MRPTYTPSVHQYSIQAFLDYCNTHVKKVRDSEIAYVKHAFNFSET